MPSRAVVAFLGMAVLESSSMGAQQPAQAKLTMLRSQVAVSDRWRRPARS